MYLGLKKIILKLNKSFVFKIHSFDLVGNVAGQIFFNFFVQFVWINWFTIFNDNMLPMQELRRRGAKKAGANNVVYEESDALREFWNILEGVLAGRHGCKPVHTVEEMERLKSAFPDNIRLFVAKADGRVVAGTLIYETEQVAHAQYIAASAEGRSVGALDGLFCYLITEVFDGKRYFDFGISTEQGGRYLNEGLAFQKEGFGARAVVYDTYKLAIGS